MYMYGAMLYNIAADMLSELKNIYSGVYLLLAVKWSSSTGNLPNR